MRVAFTVPRISPFRMQFEFVVPAVKQRTQILKISFPDGSDLVSHMQSMQ